jgi:hypothetical protein
MRFLKSAGVSFSDDPAVVEHRDLVVQMVSLVEVLGGERDRGPPPPPKTAAGV